MLLENRPFRASGFQPSSPTHGGPWPHLLRALQGLCGNQAQLLGHNERAWASVTFTGTRYQVNLAFTGAAAVSAAESLIACLPEHEFTIPHQIVADAQVLAVDHRVAPAPKIILTIELLLLEDA